MIIPASSLVEEVIALMARTRERSHLVERIRSPRNRWDRFACLREFYRRAMPEIMAEETHVWAIDPYEIDWAPLFTPIEFGAWQDIRGCGAVFYPQFPVGRYFVDFGHPVARVAIECDGAAYHTDAAKDGKRQREIEDMGWRVYRISGRDCLLPDEIEGEYDPIPNPDPARWVIREIAYAHGLALRHHGRDVEEGPL